MLSSTLVLMKFCARCRLFSLAEVLLYPRPAGRTPDCQVSSDRAMAVSCCTSYTCTLALATRQACPLTHLISAHELDARGHVLYRLLEFGPGRIVPHECLQTIPQPPHPAVLFWCSW
jgi:hypothetical protein